MEMKEIYENEKQIVYNNMIDYAEKKYRKEEFLEFFEFYGSMEKEEIVSTWLWFKMYYNI